jgi:hypothetical protein
MAAPLSARRKPPSSLSTVSSSLRGWLYGAAGLCVSVALSGYAASTTIAKLVRNPMSTAPEIAPGTKVETGNVGTPSHRTGLVVGMTDAKTLGRNEAEPSVLIAWESGEEEWAELSTLRVAK